MSLIKIVGRAVGCKAIAFFLVKLLRTGKVKELAQRVARQCDKLLDKIFGEKKSERIQEELEKVIAQFSKWVIETLREDRIKKKEVDSGKK